MSTTISVANDVIRMLDRFKEETVKATGKDEPSYSDVIKLLIASQRGLFKPHVDKYSAPAQNKSRIYVDIPHRIYADTIQVCSSAAGGPESLQ